MHIAYTSTAGRGDMDLLLSSVATEIMARGYRACGAVQVNSETCGHGKCDMDVQILPDGQIFRISQSLGTGSRGCRLDTAGLETAVGHVATRLQDGAELLIVNKFGKQEAAGRGFRPIIADALMADIPVLVGLNALNKPAFLEFVGDGAVSVAPEKDALIDWFEKVRDQIGRAA